MKEREGPHSELCSTVTTSQNLFCSLLLPLPYLQRDDPSSFVPPLGGLNQTCSSVPTTPDNHFFIPVNSSLGPMHPGLAQSRHPT